MFVQNKNLGVFFTENHAPPLKFPGDAHVTVIGVGRHGLILQAICNSDSWRSGQRYGQQPRYAWFESLDRLITFT